MAKRKSQTDNSDYQEYLQSEHWKRVAFVTKELAGNQCVLCSSTQSLNAHHNPNGYKNLNQEIPGRDTVCLCQKCHGHYHDEQKNGHGLKQCVDRKLLDTFREMLTDAFRFYLQRIESAGEE